MIDIFYEMPIFFSSNFVGYKKYKEEKFKPINSQIIHHLFTLNNRIESYRIKKNENMYNIFSIIQQETKKNKMVERNEMNPNGT